MAFPLLILLLLTGMAFANEEGEENDYSLKVYLDYPLSPEDDEEEQQLEDLQEPLDDQNDELPYTDPELEKEMSEQSVLATEPTRNDVSKPMSPPPPPEMVEVGECAPHRILLKHREANGIGYTTGYSTFMGYFTYPFSDATTILADLRGHVFNNGQWASNISLGWRHLTDSADLMMGFNVSYDYRGTNHHSQFHHIGLGLETFYGLWDIHLNGYFPVSNRTHRYSRKFDKFKEHHAYFKKKYEFDFIGGDLEIGRKLYESRNVAVHAAIGGYYFAGKYNKNAGGGLIKATANVTKYLIFEMQASYDSLFHGNVQGAVALQMPIGGDNEDRSLACESTYDLNSNFYVPLSRFEILPVDKHKNSAVARDPTTGDPLYFIFVDNLNGSSDGSFENPYRTLLQAQNNSSPNDVIYVFSGDGTTTGMDVGITLQDNQWLQGSGTEMLVDSRFGMLIIPPQTQINPTITSTVMNGSVVNLASRNIVNGFTIEGAPGNSTGVLGLGSSYATLTNLYMSGSGNTDIDIEGGAGFIQILNNSLLSATGLTFETDKDYHLRVANNSFNNSGVNILLTTDGTSVNTMEIFTNHFKNAVTSIGMDLMDNSIAKQLTIQGNVFEDFSSNGIGIATSQNAFANILIASNQTSTPFFGNAEIDILALNATMNLIEIKNNILMGTTVGQPSILITSFSLNAVFNVRVFDNRNRNSIRLGDSNFFNIQSPNLAASGLGPPINSTVPVIIAPATFIPVFPPFD